MAKFNYLRSYSKGEVASVVAGLRLTSASYEVGLGSLKERFAQKQTIINAHSRRFTQVRSCASDVHKIQNVYDSTEVHVRGLKILLSRKILSKI